jgi:RNA polymerase sigma factor (sigma-70 family)
VSSTWARPESGVIIGAIGASEERLLHQRMTATGDSEEAIQDRKRAKDRLVETAIGLVLKFTEGQHQRDDCVQECLLEVTRKIEEFDPDRGRLSTFLAPWIHKTIGEWEDKTKAVAIPRNRGEEMRQMRRAWIDLGGRDANPTVEQIAEKAGLPMATALLAQANFERWGQESSVLSLDAPISENRTLFDVAAQSIVATHQETQGASDIELLVESLPHRERLVVRAVFGFGTSGGGQSLPELAESWNMPLTEVRKVYRRGTAALRTRMAHGRAPRA